MSRMIKIVLVLGVLFLVYQFFALFFISNHTAEYSIKTKDNAYLIKEKYKKTRKFHMYSSLIEDEKHNKFVTSYDIGINRQSQIIKDIKQYKNGDLYCIAPVLKDKKIEYIACLKNNVQVSTTYLHQIGNKDIDSFISKLKSLNYEINSSIDSDSSIVKTESNLSLYNNIDKKIYITMWQYRGVSSLNNASLVNNNNYLNTDLYFNNYSILCGRYYVTLCAENISINSFFVANIKEGGNTRMDIDYSISKNIYYNGIYKNKIYFIDIDNKTQYIINPATEKIEKVEDQEKAYYYDGKTLQKVDINTLIPEKKQFVSVRKNNKIISKIGDHNYIESYDNYYYQDSDNSVYQIIGAYPKYKVLLFKFDNFKELKVKNNNLFGINGDTVYMYNNNEGLKKIVTNRELLYNYENIYDVYIDD